MSENLDFVRSIYSDWERGDFSHAAWADPQIEFVIADGPDPGSWTGVANMARAFRQRLSAWTKFRVEADELRALGDDSVLVLLHVTAGRGKLSGHELAPIAGPGANHFQIRNGKVSRLVVYLDRDRAFADLGIAPEGSASA